MQTTQNNWQNIGIMWIFAQENIPGKYRNVFMTLVQKSFGYGEKHVKINGRDLSLLCGLTRKTLYLHLSWLKDHGFIRIHKQKGYIEGGGKEAYTYYPVFPKKGNIFLHKPKKKTDKIDKKTQEANEGWTENG